MKKTVIIFLISLWFFPGISEAVTTWYVRTDGGTNTQCTGTTDAAYPGSGTGQACGLNHPNWVFPPRGENTSTEAQSGDTVIIHGPEAGTGMYRIGCQNASTCRNATFNLTQSAYCDPDYPYDCTMGEGGTTQVGIPDITLIGCSATGCAGNTRPQLWAAGRLSFILKVDASSSGATVSDLEMTDHSGCGYRIGDYQCDETSASLAGQNVVVLSNATNVLLKNLWIHGLGAAGLFGHTTGGVVFDNVNLDKNASAGWNADDGNGVSGTVTFQDHAKVTYSGCIENYPLTGYSSNTRNDILECVDQNDGGYGDGIGTGNGTTGAWSFTDSEVSHNVQDGIDILHSTGSGSLEIFRTKLEGNNGQGYKTSLSTNVIENSIIIGNCAYFVTAGIPLASGFVPCRANGGVIVAIPAPGWSLNIKNSTIWNDGDTITQTGGSTCDGTNVMNVDNSILYGALSQTGSGNNAGAYYCAGSDGNGAGPCCNGGTTVVVNWSHDDIFNTKTPIPTGTAIQNVDPHLAQGDNINTEPNTDFFNAYLTANSTAVIGAADNTISLVGTPNDYNNVSRGSSWDEGGFQHNTCATSPTGCSVTGNCCSGVCLNNMCAASSCTSDSTWCPSGITTGLECCSPYCINNSCTSLCIITGNSCNYNTDCCSDICTGNLCQPGIVNKAIISGSLNISGKCNLS